MSRVIKINVRVANKYIDKGYCYTFNCGTYEVEPFKIVRSEAGSYTKTAMKYYYVAHFVGFGDMLNIHNKSLVGVESYENIHRKSNPKFNPKKLNWVGNVAIVNQHPELLK